MGSSSRARAGKTSRAAVPRVAAKRSRVSSCMRGTDLASEVRHEEDVEVHEMIRGILRRMRGIGGEYPFGATSAAIASRRAAAAATDCETEQMPQIRGASASASGADAPRGAARSRETAAPSPPRA